MVEVGRPDPLDQKIFVVNRWQTGMQREWIDSKTVPRPEGASSRRKDSIWWLHGRIEQDSQPTLRLDPHIFGSCLPVLRRVVECCLAALDNIIEENEHGQFTVDVSWNLPSIQALEPLLGASSSRVIKMAGEFLINAVMNDFGLRIWNVS